MNWYLQGAARGRADKQLWGMDGLPLYKAKPCPASCPYPLFFPRQGPLILEELPDSG